MSNLGSTKIFVDKSQWNNKTSRQKGRSSEALAVNASLDAISTNLHNIYRKYEDDESISLDKLRAAYLGQAKEYTSFLPVFDKFIDDISHTRFFIGYIEYSCIGLDSSGSGCRLAPSPHRGTALGRGKV